MQKKTECCNSLVSESLRVVNGTEGNYLILFYKNIQCFRFCRRTSEWDSIPSCIGSITYYI